MGKSLTCKKKFLVTQPCINQWENLYLARKSLLQVDPVYTNGKITNLQEKVSCTSALYKPMEKSLTCEKKFLASRPCINQWGNH